MNTLKKADISVNIPDLIAYNKLNTFMFDLSHGLSVYNRPTLNI